MLNILVFLGSVRTSTPPRPARLGERVARACTTRLGEMGMQASLIDPLDYPRNAVFKPQFAYAAGKAPGELDELASRIEAADGYVMVSPEYNHSLSPALADLLNHFGSSLFSYKPSVIATYSAGQWGGTRAAMTIAGVLVGTGMPAGVGHDPRAPCPGCLGRGRVLSGGRRCRSLAGLSRPQFSAAGMVGTSGEGQAGRSDSGQTRCVPQRSRRAQCTLI